MACAFGSNVEPSLLMSLAADGGQAQQSCSCVHISNEFEKTDSIRITVAAPPSIPRTPAITTGLV
jgi:hypothetical protein